MNPAATCRGVKIGAGQGSIMTKDVAGIIYNKMTSVAEKFFKANPLKRFPDDFLTKKVKRELEDRKSNPKTTNPLAGPCLRRGKLRG